MLLVVLLVLLVRPEDQIAVLLKLALASFRQLALDALEEQSSHDGRDGQRVLTVSERAKVALKIGCETDAQLLGCTKWHRVIGLLKWTPCETTSGKAKWMNATVSPKTSGRPRRDRLLPISSRSQMGKNDGM